MKTLMDVLGGMRYLPHVAPATQDSQDPVGALAEAAILIFLGGVVSRTIPVSQEKLTCVDCGHCGRVFLKLDCWIDLVFDAE